MIIWRKGMLAVCVDDGPWIDMNSGNVMVGPSQNDVSQVVNVYTDEAGDLMLILNDWPDPEGYIANEFRPAVLDNKAADTDFTALIKGKVGA